MRKVTVCAAAKLIKLPTHSYQTYRMQPGTAWKLDVYGQHVVIEVNEALCKKTEHVDGCTMHFDGRQMAIFRAGEEKYLQPLEEDARATDDRLGKKRKKRKLSKARRDAPGVAPQAVSWENDGPEPREQPEALRLAKRAGKVKGKGCRAGPRGGLDVLC